MEWGLTTLRVCRPVQALLTAYAEEEADEAQPEKTDAFARKWMKRLEVLLLDSRVIEVESQGAHPIEEQAKTLEQIQDESTQRRLKRARMAQREDDRALQEALPGASGSASSGQPPAQPPGAAGSKTYEVMMRRVLNGIPIQPAQPVAMCGGSMEVAIQMQVVEFQGAPSERAVQERQKGLEGKGERGKK